MAGIVAVGFEPGAFLPAHPPPPAFPDALSRADLEALTETVSDGIVRHGHVIAVYPSWSPEPALQRLQTVRSALATTRLATYASPLPPLAGGVLTSLTAALAPLARPVGGLLAALPLLEAHLLVVAWLGRVTGLREPAPSVLQHAVSMLPGTAFGVSSWPQPSVRRLSQKDRTVPLPQVSGGFRLASAARDGDLGWVGDVVAPALGNPPLLQVEATRLGPRWWGARRLVEVVGYPTDLAGLVTLVEEQPVLRCSWCEQHTAAGEDACAFCRRRLTLAPTLEPAA